MEISELWKKLKNSIIFTKSTKKCKKKESPKPKTLLKMVQNYICYFLPIAQSNKVPISQIAIKKTIF